MRRVHLSVDVDGEELSDQVLRMELDEQDSLADLVTLTFGDSHLILADLLVEGQAIEIDLGWTDEHAVVFRGVVTGIRGNYPSGGLPSVEVEAIDSLITLSLRPKTRRWTSAPAQIVSAIAVDNHLVPGIVDLAEPAGELPGEGAAAGRPLLEQQVEETDLAFLQRLAREYDCKVFVDHTEANDTLNFIATRKLLGEDPLEHALTFNANLQSFAPSFDLFATDPEERLITTDPSTADRVQLSQKLIDGTEGLWVPDPDRIARLGDGAGRVASLAARAAPRHTTVTDTWRRPPRLAGAPSRPSSDQAGILGDQSRRLGQIGRGRTPGNIWLRPRKRVKVEGYGGRWSGTWYLARTRHLLDLPRRSFVTSFVCTR
jgi:late control gene D protein (GPD)